MSTFLYTLTLEVWRAKYNKRNIKDHYSVKWFGLESLKRINLYSLNTIVPFNNEIQR